MRKILLSAAALFAAMSMNAQVVVTVNPDNALELADDGSPLTAGTVLWEGEQGTLTVGADDTYKKQGIKANVGGTDIAGGLQGGSNPKDADGGTPATTLLAPVSGAFFTFEAKADGFLYVIHKASSNKAYTVFEEGAAIGYTFAAVAGDGSSILGSTYKFTLKGEGEYNNLVNPVDWAEQEYLKQANPTAYEANFTVAEDGTKSWNKIGMNGLGVIVFPVFADCKYNFNANGSKMSLAGFAFNTEDNMVVKDGDVVVYDPSGTPSPTPVAGDQVVVIVNPDNTLELADDGSPLTAGTVLWEGEQGELTIGADDTYKKQDIKANVAGQDIAGGLQGSSNPKDADGGTPATTLLAPVSGAFFTYNAKADGFLYVIHKASSNKAYTVFEEGAAIGYTFAAVAGDGSSILGSTYKFTLKGEGEYNNLVNPVDWAEQEYLKQADPAAYEANFTVAEDGTKSWNKIGMNGLSVIVFPVFADCAYNFNANGSKMSLAGIAFSSKDDVVVKDGDVVVYDPSGSTGIQATKTIVISNGAIYNLAGQKVNASYKGVVIKDGKKMIQK